MGCVLLFWFVSTLFAVLFGGWRNLEELLLGLTTAWGITLIIAFVIMTDPEAT
jgi:hypothetical protein